MQPRAEMSQYVNELWPGSPQDKESPSTSRSGRSSRLSSASRSRSSSGSARSGSSGSSRASSRVRTRRRSRSRSWSRRLHQRKYRRYSRSYSRSRSRSRGRRYRDRRCGASGRYRQSPSRPRSRSRSRSRGRSYYRRASALPRGRRFYGFGRSVCPEERKSWRARSRTRSRSPTPFRLSEKGESSAANLTIAPSYVVGDSTSTLGDQSCRVVWLFPLLLVPVILVVCWEQRGKGHIKQIKGN